GKTINRPFPNSQKNIQQPILKNQLTSDTQRNMDVNKNNKEKVEPSNTPASIPSDAATLPEKNKETNLKNNIPKKDEIKQNTNTQIANAEVKKATQKNNSKNKNARLAN